MEGLENIHWLNVSGIRELQHAATAGVLEAVRSLLDGGNDLNADHGTPLDWTSLTEAAYHGHLQVVRLLAERGAHLDAFEVDRLWTALDVALDAGRAEFEAYLISVGTPTGTQIPNLIKRTRSIRLASTVAQIVHQFQFGPLTEAIVVSRDNLPSNSWETS